MRLQGYSRTGVILLAAVVIGLMVACTCVPPTQVGQTKPSVVIVSPAEGSSFLVGEPISVQVLATDSQGVRRIELQVAGGTVDTASSPSPQPSFNATLSWTPNSAGTHALVVMAYNATDTASDPAIVRVNVQNSQAGNGAAPTIVAFVADPPAITAGDSATLHWEVADATTVEIEPGIGPVALSGSQTVSPGTTTTYQLMAYSEGGNATTSATVTVNPGGAPGTIPVIHVFAADPPVITAGDSSTLRWEVTDAASVEIDHGIGTVALSGSRSVNPGSTTTYVLTAHGTGGNATATVQVTVNAAAPAACVPNLVSPANGATLDNGRTDHLDSMVWDFNWSDCPGATQYHLYVIGSGASVPAVDKDDIAASAYQHSSAGYVPAGNLTGWTWKVRARVGGTWGPWSSTRTFNVEPPDTDAASGGTINATLTYHSYDASSGWVTFRVQNTGSLALESARCQIINRSTSANYYGPGTSNSPFRDNPTSDTLVGSVAAGATKYMRYKLSGNPTGVPCRATITLYSQDGSGGSNVLKTVDFDLPGSSGTINANITAHSYDASTGWVTFQVQNTGSLALESARTQIINRSTNANYYGPATSNSPFRNSATSDTLVGSVAAGATKYMRYKLSGNPTGVPCRATITLYSQDNSGGSSVTKTVD
ncbi:MAG: hypothetical protein KKA73_24360, partial [Chloroflexi bacterium]|nr:hypothetical protein [Chloroflexota bacterium]